MSRAIIPGSCGLRPPRRIFIPPCRPAVDLNQVSRLETRRTVSNDGVGRHDHRLLQIDRRGRHYPPARSTVLVCEYEDGHLELQYRGERVPWTEITVSAQLTKPEPPHPAAPSLPRRSNRPSPQHPWRRSYRQLPDRFSPGEHIPGRVAPRLTGG